MATPAVHHHRNQMPGDDEASPYCETSAITVVGDQLILTPNVGYVISVGRFDGKIRWMNGYPLAKVHGMDRPAIASHRFDNHPYVVGSTIVAAAQDAVSATGFDLSTGALLWQSPALVDDTLIGTVGDTAVFAGRTRLGVQRQNRPDAVALPAEGNHRASGHCRRFDIYPHP